MRVELPPHPGVRRNVDVVAGEALVVDVEIGAAVSFSGVVVDDLGRAVPGANVSLATADAAGVRWTETAADGTFRVEGLPRGDTTLTVGSRTSEFVERRASVSVPGEGVRITDRGVAIAAPRGFDHFAT